MRRSSRSRRKPSSRRQGLCRCAQARDRHRAAVPLAFPIWHRAKKRSKLARVVIPDDAPAAHVLRDLVRPPEGMMVVGLSDGSRIFAPAGIDPDAARAQIESGKMAP